MRATTVDILVCTYKRVHLLQRTLDTIEREIAPGLQVRVLVIDNDAAQSAMESVSQRTAAGRLSYFYLVQPVQNISHARNTALDAASADFVVMIDDDSAPRPGWLAALVNTAQRFHADVVFAPVLPEYAPDVPCWIRRGGFFDNRRRFRTGAEVPQADRRSGNALLRTEIIDRTGARFDPELGLSGGEDSAFFHHLEHNGARQVWCDEAVVDEWIPSSRGNIRWLLKRSFRVGSVRSFIDSRRGRIRATFYFLLKGAALVAQGTLIAVMNGLLFSVRAIRGLQKISVGAGMYYGIFIGPYQEYACNSKASRRASRQIES